jgi:hypothetical protein
MRSAPSFQSSKPTLFRRPAASGIAKVKALLRHGAVSKSKTRRRLQQGATPGIAPPAATGKQGGVEMTDANGNRAIVYPDGSFEEL